MASIVIAGDTSGSVTISAPAIAGTPTLTLPTTSGTIAVTGGSPSFATLTVTGDASISGLTVGKGGGSVSSNTAVGNGAMSASATGTFNTGVGRIALYSLTSGASNSGFGNGSLYANTTGSNNTAIGQSALQANTTADNNTAVGYQAGYSQQTGIQNTYIGVSTGYTDKGLGNTFIGWQAGYTANSGANVASVNTCVGYNAGYALTTGKQNCFIGGAPTASGIGSGANITTGSSNTIIGSYNGNQDNFDIRTANKYIVISDGDGERAITAGRGNSLALNDATPKAGTGITFPATQSASSDANTLDDYEEGTWTPTVTFGGGSTGVTYAVQRGNYTKIGNRVFISMYILITNKGSSTGILAIQGLPFASVGTSAQYNNVAIWANTLSSITGSLQGYNSPGTTSITEISFLGTGANNPVNNTNLNTNSDFMVNFSYSI